jgi:hypothetical protein
MGLKIGEGVFGYSLSVFRRHSRINGLSAVLGTFRLQIFDYRKQKVPVSKFVGAAGKFSRGEISPADRPPPSHFLAYWINGEILGCSCLMLVKRISRVLEAALSETTNRDVLCA